MPRGLGILRQKLMECGRGYKGCFLFMEDMPEGSNGKNRTKKQIRLSGNIPLLPPGAFVILDVEYKGDTGIITDYSVPHNERNMDLFRKYGDCGEYIKKLDLHKLLGVKWNEIDLVLKNPYKVYPFMQADDMARKLNRPADSPERLESIAKEIIKLSRAGRGDHMGMEDFLSFEQRAEETGSYPSLSYAKKMKILGSECFRFRDGMIEDREIKEAEEYIAKDMKYRCGRNEDFMSGDVLKYIDCKGLDEEQMKAVECLKTLRPSIITGGAGSGKTTVVSALIQCYESSNADAQITLLAPTGRASRRLTEVTGHEASTIHKGLRLLPDKDGNMGFSYFCAQKKLDAGLVIVDESSMIDTLLMARLLKAVKDDAKLVFVGDHQQLRPVGVGEPFFDFLQGGNEGDGCDISYLLHNHRQGKNDIAKAADSVIHHVPFHAGRGVSINNVKRSRIPDLVKQIEEENGKKLNPSVCQIISPFNSLNGVINDTLRNKDMSEFTDRFAVDDKVMAIHNSDNYCNGDVGFVTAINDGGVYIQFEDGRRVFIDWCDMEDIQLAYSITVHKMQGSECRKVYLFLPKDQSDFIEERLLYTAITRAKEELNVYYYDSELYESEAVWE